MSIESYFYDIEEVEIEFNGEKMTIKEYEKKKDTLKLQSKDKVKPIELKVYYSNEQAGYIKGYLLNLENFSNEIIDKATEEEIYWILEDIWDDMATLFKMIMDNSYPRFKNYFLIKNVKSTAEFDGDGVEMFLLDQLREMAHIIDGDKIDYLVLINDTNKFKLSQEKVDLNFYGRINLYLMRILKKLGNAGKELKKGNISTIANNYDFYSVETSMEKVKVWFREYEY